ncbi:MAG: SUMF1/EgtB/PvdO family nonheme iron enzyme [Verrucomicrobiales bacterium]|nr:SUMF1/EgtB/PvdO family nonheme iron enzyme [Verrucomicrobiales bacterium]
MRTAAKTFTTGLDFNQQYDLQRVLFQNAGLTVEVLSNSYLNWSGTLEISGNFQSLKLNQFASHIGGNVDFRVEARVAAQGAADLEFSTNFYTSPPQRFMAVIPAGPITIPVWFDAIFELNVGCSNHLEGALDYTNGVQASKTFLYGNRWDVTNGWSTYSQNPALELNYLGPRWSAAGFGNLHLWFQPKVRLLVYSALGMAYSLQPYDDLVGRYQSNPYEFELALYAGMTGDMAVDMAVFADYLPALPSYPFEFIPRTLLWQTNNLAQPPQITGQPSDQWVTAGGTASFTVAANGPGTLSYRWQKNGLWLSDDSRITGTHGSTLHIVNCTTGDAGSYTVLVSNPNGTVTSQDALLTVYPTNISSGMALIPAGSFTMGNCMDPSEGWSDELPLHSVYVSAFYMDKYDVTKTLWDSVYSWAITHGYTFDNAGSGKAANHPVQTVDWHDCVKWCNARSEKEGRVPAYYTSAAQTTVYRTGQVNVDNSWVNWNAGYRLPTEAEWEKAARGGASGQRFPWGNTVSWSLANYYAYPLSAGGYAYDVNATQGLHPAFNDGISPYTSPVGYFAPNGYGLYDMTGNVWQWCWDWFGDYLGSFQSDPRGPTDGSNRVIRGGSWVRIAFYCRTAIRGHREPTYGYDGFDRYGFRSVLPSGQ